MLNLLFEADDAAHDDEAADQHGHGADHQDGRTCAKGNGQWMNTFINNVGSIKFKNWINSHIKLILSINSTLGMQPLRIYNCVMPCHIELNLKYIILSYLYKTS